MEYHLGRAISLASMFPLNVIVMTWSFFATVNIFRTCIAFGSMQARRTLIVRFVLSNQNARLFSTIPFSRGTQIRLLAQKVPTRPDSVISLKSSQTYFEINLFFPPWLTSTSDLAWKTNWGVTDRHVWCISPSTWNNWKKHIIMIVDLPLLPLKLSWRATNCLNENQLG